MHSSLSLHTNFSHLPICIHHFPFYWDTSHIGLELYSMTSLHLIIVLKKWNPMNSHFVFLGIGARRPSIYLFIFEVVWGGCETVHPKQPVLCVFIIIISKLGDKSVSSRHVMPHTVLCVDPRWSKSVFSDCYRENKSWGKNGKGWKFLPEMLENQMHCSKIGTQSCSLPLIQKTVCGHSNFAKIQ